MKTKEDESQMNYTGNICVPVLSNLLIACVKHLIFPSYIIKNEESRRNIFFKKLLHT
jgi:hypothetical protein